MRRVVLVPLTPEYDILSISTSSLDKFEYQTSAEKKEENYEWWDILHSILLTTLFCPDKAQFLYQYYLPDIDKKKKEWILDAMKHSAQLPQLLAIEQKKRLAIEYWRYLIILTGKFDGLYIKDDKLVLVDVKTAKQVVDYENKWQLKTYAFINSISNIEYWIFPQAKDNRPRIESFEVDLEKNQKEVLVKIVDHISENYGYEYPNIRSLILTS